MMFSRVLINTLKNPWMDFAACRGFQKPLQKRHFARALLEQNGLRKSRTDFLNNLIDREKPVFPLQRIMGILLSWHVNFV